MTLTELFTNIANAIRTKKGTSDKILATNFATEIENLPSGGGDISEYFTESIRVGNSSNSGINQSIKKIPKLDASNVTDFRYMFKNCTSLIEISQIDTSKGINFDYMFYNCITLTTIAQIDTSNGTNFSNMFYYCLRLTTIAQIDTSNGTNFIDMFYHCYTLTDLGGLLNAGKSFTQKSNNYSKYTINLSDSTSLTYDSLMNVINNLYDLNLTYDVANGGTLYTQKLILGSTNTAKLTAEEIAIATAKGWTVS